MRKVKVLIVEWEEQTIEKIRSLLDEESYDVSIAKDGVEALQIALQKVPDFIMLSVDLPLIDGVKLSQILRTNPKTESIPIFYMNEKTLQLSHFRRNIDYFIIKPFNLDELKKILVTLKKKILSIQDKKYEEEFAGNLKQMGIPDLVQILSINHRTGNLYIYSSNQNVEKPLAIVAINEGKIINSKMGDTTKEKAFYRVLSLHDGYFRFIPGEPLLNEEIKVSTDSLIMEGLRQNDELVELRKKIPLSAKLKLNIKLSQLPENLRPITKEIINAIEIFPEISDLLNNIDATDYEIYKIILALVEKNIVTLEVDNKKEEEKRKLNFSSDIILELKKKVSKIFFDSRLCSNIYVLLFVSDRTILSKFVKFLGALNFEPSKENIYKLIDSKIELGYLGKIILVDGHFLHLFCFCDKNISFPLYEGVFKNTIGAIVLGKRDNFREALHILNKKHVVIDGKESNDDTIKRALEKVFEYFIQEA
jgi:CheY-like chemotaxis protein